MLLDFRPAVTPALFQLLEKAFVELAMDVDVAVEQLVFNRALIQLVGFLLLLFELLAQHDFLLLGGEKLATYAIGDFLEFQLNLRVDFLQLIVELCDFRIGRAELRAQLGNLDFCVSLFGPEAGNQRREAASTAGSASFQGSCRRSHHIGVPGLHETIERLFTPCGRLPRQSALY
jgi:hypothetical protein